MFGFKIVVVLVLFLGYGVSDLVIYNATRYVYDQTSPLIIYGTDLKSIVNNSVFVLGSEHLSLQQGIDFRVKETNQYTILFNRKVLQVDGVVLVLENQRSWAYVSTRDPPVFMTLSSIFLVENPSVNLLPLPLDIARVLPTPGIEFDQTTIAPTADLYIRGSGLIGATYADFEFDPPLLKFSDYMYQTPFPLTDDLVILRVTAPFGWRSRAGPLSVLSIDTGAGKVTINGKTGVQVANIGSGAGNPSTIPTLAPISYSPTQLGIGVYPGVLVYPSVQKVYLSTVWSIESIVAITIYGENFDCNWIISDLLFNMAMNDVVMTVEPTKITLTPRISWAMTGELILTDMYFDQHYVSVNLHVATIYAAPAFDWRNDIYSLSQSHLITITGSNFNVLAPVQVELSPVSSDTFVVHNVTPNSITLRLLPYKKWLPDTFLGFTGNRLKEVDLVGVNFGMGWVKSKIGRISMIGYVTGDIVGFSCYDSCLLAYNGVCEDLTAYWSPSPPTQTTFLNNSRSCYPGTDCTDCGGVRALIEAPYTNEPEYEGCSNTCFWAFDGVCDVHWCGSTDCHDCGPKATVVATVVDSDEKETDFEPYILATTLLLLSLFGVCVARLRKRNEAISNAATTTDRSPAMEMTEYSRLSQSDYDLEAALQQSRNEFELEGGGGGDRMPTTNAQDEDEQENLVSAYTLEEDSVLQGDHVALPELVPLECEFDVNRPPQADCELTDLTQVTTAVVHTDVEVAYF